MEGLIAGPDEAPAIRAPDREPLSYLALKSQVERTGRLLRGASIGAEDRVAIVLPNGPAMAGTFVCMAP